MELQKRQVDDIKFTITSVNPSPDSIEIAASGPAGRYGNAFWSCVLESFDGNSGSLHGTGCGFPDEGPMMTGNFVGFWRRDDGNKIEIKLLADVDNGDQNLDIITIDMHAKTILIRPYILETVTLQ